jgi:hypothetical protein
MNDRTAEQLAKAYDATPESQEALEPAFAILTRYVHNEFRRLTAAGWRFEPIKDDRLLPDLKTADETMTLKVLDTFHKHPGWSDTTNYMFRAVHDVRGHIEGEALGFTLEDEVKAFRHNSQHFKLWSLFEGLLPREVGQCIGVLFCEIVGQAAYFKARGRFPEQKAAILRGIK